MKRPVLIFDPPETPYQEGYNSAYQGDGGKSLPCPYPEGSSDYERWWEGFGDETDDHEADMGFCG